MDSCPQTSAAVIDPNGMAVFMKAERGASFIPLRENSDHIHGRQLVPPYRGRLR